MRKTTRQFNKARAAFKEKCKAENAPCWICGFEVDYQAPADDYKNDDRFELDHFYPVSTHPELQHDPGNFRASHSACNRERGAGSPRPPIGIPSRKWA